MKLHQIGLTITLALCVGLAVSCQKSEQGGKTADKTDPAIGTWQMGPKTIEIREDGTMHSPDVPKTRKKHLAECSEAKMPVGPEPQNTWSRDASGTYTLKTVSLRTKLHPKTPCKWNTRINTAQLKKGSLVVKAGGNELVLKRIK